jgi:hypothetical protein
MIAPIDCAKAAMAQQSNAIQIAKFPDPIFRWLTTSQIALKADRQTQMPY